MAFWRGELLKVIAQVKAIPTIDTSIHTAEEATAPVDADELPLLSSADAFVVKKITWANVKAAIWVAFGALINGGTAKATPVDNDVFAFGDSAASFATKKLTWANIKTALNAALSFYKAGGTDVAVDDGGTGRSSHTAYAVICGGTTGTGAQQSIASVGSSGQVLTSNGAGALPTFQALPAAGWTKLGTITTTSGSSQSLSSLTLTNYSFLKCVLNGVSGTAISSNITQNGNTICALSGGAVATGSGIMDIALKTGGIANAVTQTSGGTVTSFAGNSGVTTASTSITFAISTGSFDAGSIDVYAL